MILLVGALSLATKQLNFGIDFESGTRIKVALVRADRRGRGPRHARRGRASTARRSSRSPTRCSATNVFQIQARRAPAGNRSKSAEQALADEFGVAEDGFDSTSVGPTFGQQVADSALKALIFSLLVICGYVALRFDPEVRGAGPDRDPPRHPDHGRRLLAGGERGEQRDRRRLPHHLGLLHLRHVIVFDRIRENVPRMPRAAFSQIVNRSMSEVLTRSLATSFSTLLGVALAADLRRRDPAGLRLRDAGRDRLRYLLVDLHRLAGADRLEGTRAGLRPPARCGSPRSRAACRPSPTTSRWRSSATTRPKPSRPRGRAAPKPSREAGAVAHGRARRRRQRRRSAPATGGRGTRSAERRQRNAERRGEAPAAPQAREEPLMRGI